jgi:hypothetical protein
MTSKEIPMKQFMSQVKDLSQRAAEIKAAMQQVPPKVAEIREAVAATTGQLHQLKSEIQYSVADLKADDEDRLSTALQEINSSEEIFARAGFLLSGVDLEISPVQRLLVRLARHEEVHPSILRSLMSANQHRRTIHAILSSLLQAGQMAETVQLGALDYREILIGVGPIPSVRLCWRPEEAEQAMPAAEAEQEQRPASPPPLPAAAPASLTMFGPGSFFEKRPAPPEAATAGAVKSEDAAAMAPSGSAAEPVAPAACPAAPAPEQSRDPLARFKRMPDFSKHQRQQPV